MSEVLLFELPKLFSRDSKQFDGSSHQIAIVGPITTRFSYSFEDLLQFRLGDIQLSLPAVASGNEIVGLMHLSLGASAVRFSAANHLPVNSTIRDQVIFLR